MTSDRFKWNQLIFAGEAIVDLAIRVPTLPNRGGDVLASSASIQVGGGFNTMAAAARQGLPVAYAGGHGTGRWGDLVRKSLASEGISLLRQPDPQFDTGFTVGLLDDSGEQTYVTSLGAETLRDPHAWRHLQGKPGDIIYIDGYGLAASEAGPLLRDWVMGLPEEVLLFVDPGPLAADIPDHVLTSVLGRCDWWSCNRREAGLIVETDDLQTAAAQLLSITGREGVIVRDGAAGCVLKTRMELVEIPAPPVKALDTTGAGDTHAGAFLAAISTGMPAVQAARRANAAAALSVTRRGPATAPTRTELDQFLDRQASDPRNCAPTGITLV